MDTSKLAAANELSKRINKLATVVKRLQDPGLYIRLHKNNKEADSLITTIGVGENCEHELAPLATEFHAAVVAHYEAKLSGLQAEFEAL